VRIKSTEDGIIFCDNNLVNILTPTNCMHKLTIKDSEKAALEITPYSIKTNIPQKGSIVYLDDSQYIETSFYKNKPIETLTLTQNEEDYYCGNYIIQKPFPVGITSFTFKYIGAPFSTEVLTYEDLYFQTDPHF
jgi:hypothetical protein